jgi:hypothetical protein
MRHAIRLSVNGLALLAGTLMLATPVYAQDSSGVQQQPAGVGVLLLLMGLAAIVLVTAVYVVQSRPTRDASTTENAKEDDK